LIFRFAVLVALVVELTAAPVIAPPRAAAQEPASAAAPAATSPGNSAAAETPKSAEAPQSAEDEEQAFLHSSVVQSLARLLHLKLDTAVDIFLGINFAIIFFAIAIPLTRMGPKIIRKRSQTLRHDLQTARDATADAQARLSAVEAKLAGLDEEMRNFRAQVERESLEDEKRIKAALGEESARIVAAAEQEIGVAAAQAKRGLRNFAADLAIEQATKQLALTPDDDRAVIAEFISGVAGDGTAKGGKN
jgi:F-type H+-transporting ATPase subunit b